MTVVYDETKKKWVDATTGEEAMMDAGSASALDQLKRQQVQSAAGSKEAMVASGLGGWGGLGSAMEDIKAGQRREYTGLSTELSNQAQQRAMSESQITGEWKGAPTMQKLQFEASQKQAKDQMFNTYLANLTDKVQKGEMSQDEFKQWSDYFRYQIYGSISSQPVSTPVKKQPATVPEPTVPEPPVPEPPVPVPTVTGTTRTQTKEWLDAIAPQWNVAGPKYIEQASGQSKQFLDELNAEASKSAPDATKIADLKTKITYLANFFKNTPNMDSIVGFSANWTNGKPDVIWGWNSQVRRTVAIYADGKVVTV